MPADAPPARLRNPWWTPPFLFGRVPEGIGQHHMTLLGFVAFALFFENYDYSLLNAALPFIADDLGLVETELPSFLARLRLVALPAFLLIPFADQVGRRRLFLLAVIGLSTGTFLTAFSQTPFQFLACQMLTRTSMLAASATAIVIVTEEFPAGRRGWGIGVLGAVASVGYGLGSGVFAAIESLPYGWRALYVFGFAPVLMLPLFRRGIRETQRFERHQAEQLSTHGAPGGLGAVLAAWFRPVVGILRTHPLRAGGMAVAASLSAFGHALLFSFAGLFVINYHGWEPYQYTLMVVVLGAIGVPGQVIAGHLADRVGRRSVGATFLALFPVCAWLFFHGPSWVIPMAWPLVIFTTVGASVIIRALSTELFPTSHRGTSAGFVALMETLGAGLGLLVLSLFTLEPGDLIRMIPAVSMGTLVGALVLLLLPETSQRELETISKEEPAALRPEPAPAMPTVGAESSVRSSSP